MLDPIEKLLQAELATAKRKRQKQKIAEWDAQIASGENPTAIALRSFSSKLAKINDRIPSNQAGIEKLLAEQAALLDAIFARLVAIAGEDQSDPEHLERYLGLALQVQNQGRKTLEALAEVKHPRKSTFIKQQLNQLRVENAESMDRGTTQAPKRINQAMEAVAEVHRTPHRSRKKESIQERL